MTPVQIQLVQDSWQRVLPHEDAVAQAFYSRLFELNPELGSLFRSDQQEQRRKFMQMISLTVEGLSQPELLVPMLHELGRRHVDLYRVVPHNYDSLGAALLWTLKQNLGDAFSDELRQAWSQTYQHMALAMQEGEWSR